MMLHQWDCGCALYSLGQQVNRQPGSSYRGSNYLLDIVHVGCRPTLSTDREDDLKTLML